MLIILGTLTCYQLKVCNHSPDHSRPQTPDQWPKTCPSQQPLTPPSGLSTAPWQQMLARPMHLTKDRPECWKFPEFHLERHLTTCHLRSAPPTPTALRFAEFNGLSNTFLPILVPKSHPAPALARPPGPQGDKRFKAGILRNRPKREAV